MTATITSASRRLASSATEKMPKSLPSAIVQIKHCWLFLSRPSSSTAALAWDFLNVLLQTLKAQQMKKKCLHYLQGQLPLPNEQKAFHPCLAHPWRTKAAGWDGAAGPAACAFGFRTAANPTLLCIADVKQTVRLHLMQLEAAGGTGLSGLAMQRASRFLFFRPLHPPWASASFGRLCPACSDLEAASVLFLVVLADDSTDTDPVSRPRLKAASSPLCGRPP